MTSRYYTMTDSTGESGFLPTVTFTSTNSSFTYAQRTAQLASIPGTPIASITGLYEADFADNITTIDTGAFDGDVKVVVVTINKVTTISANAFKGCSALRSITLDCAVDANKKYLLTTIGTNAFYGCSSLRHLHIPDTVKVIPDYMCYNCTNLEFAVMGYGWNRNGNDYVRDSTIGTEAFNNCYALSYFVVPETVASIGSLAFANTLSLSLVTILGRPTIASDAFSAAKSAGATYYYDNSASYTDLTLITSNTPFPGANKRAYREIDLSGASALTNAHVNARVPVTTWWKGKILNTVSTLDTACFRSQEITTSRSTYMIGVSFPSTLTSIGYTAFESNNAVTNVAGFYIPNTVTTFARSGANTFTFALGSTGNRDISNTKQFVIQSGPNTLSLGDYSFYYNSASAFIISNITGLPYVCFYYCKNTKLFSFFQKNAYSLLTSIGADSNYVLEGCFDSGIAGYRHYVYIHKQVTSIGVDAFRFMLDKLVVNIYHNSVNSAGVSQTTGLGVGGYIRWHPTSTGYRFQGSIYPTFHIVYNNYNAAGTLLAAANVQGDGFAYHLLYSPYVTTIATAFGGAQYLRSVAIDHNAVQTVTINDTAFQNCTYLFFVYLNNRVKIIGYNAFRNIQLSSSFDLIDASPLEQIYHAAFFTDNITCNLSQITIPKTVKILGSFVFASQLGFKTSFTTLSFENGIEFWGDYDNNNNLGASSAIANFGTLNSSNVRHMAIPHQFCINCDNLTSVSFLNTALDQAGTTPVPNDGLALARPNNSLPMPTRYNTQILNPPIKRISNGAFQANYRLQSIRIPEGVTTIDSNAFFETYSLTYLYLPDTLTSIALNAFSKMNFDNKFSYTGKEVSVRVPQSRIDDVANATTIKFNPTSVSTYFINVTYDNTSASGKVTSGVLGRFTTSGVDPFIKYHVVIQSGITGILGGTTVNARAFDNFTSIKTVTIADSVTDIGVGALYNCTGLTNVFISPTSNLTILNDSAVQECTALTSFFIPNSVKSINYNAFYGCTSLATVNYGNNPGLKSIGINAFVDVGKTMTSIFIPSSVVSIGNSAFLTSVNTNVNLLNTVTFGAGSRLRSIDYQCFGHNGSNIQRSLQYLRDFVLPNSLRYLGPTSTGNSSALQNTHRISHSANLVMPVSLEVIPWAFLYADASAVDISNVYFPRSITNSVGPRKHNGYSMNNAPTPVSTGLMGAEFNASKAGTLIYLPSELSTYTSTVNGATTYPFPNFSGTNRARSYYRTVAYTTNPLITLGLSGTVANTTNATTTTQIHADIKDGVIVIGGGTSIASANSGNALNLISMNIPSTVTTISDNAFNGSNGLTYVTFSENSKLTTIGNSAFLGCTMIHDIQLPDTVTTIGANAFSGCYNLASISIPYNVTSIGAGAFNVNNNTSTTDIVRSGGYVAYQLGQDIYGEAISDYSGYSVSLSQDGKILAIGAYLNDATGGDAGQVRVYKYQTITDTTWTNYTVNGYLQTGTSPYNKPIVINGGDVLPVSGKSYWVQLGMDINGEAGYNYAGWSVSLNSDGTTLAIGALVNSGAGVDAGQTRVYKYQTIAAADWTNYTVNSFTFVTNKPIVVNGGDALPVSGKFYWVQLGADIDGETINSQSGISVSLSSNGQIVAIGARLDDLNSATNSGSARVYQYNGTAWSKLGSTITAGSADDQFGWVVSLNDAGTVLAIGALYADNGAAIDAGIVRVYAYSGSAWTQRGSNINGDAQWDYSGVSVSLNSDGTILAIGAIGNDAGNANSDNRGQARVYKWNGSSWSKLGQNINGLASGDELGVSVSLNSDGTLLAVGSRLSDTGSVSNTGLVRIYKFFNGTWQQLGQDIRGEFAGDQAAWSVSLSKDGTTVAFGAHLNYGNGADSGMVSVYQIGIPFNVRLHQRLYNDISGSLSTYFPGVSLGSIQVIPALTLTNTLNPSKLTISQINNMYIRYRQSQLGVTFITVAASAGGILTVSDVTTALASSTGFVHLEISNNVTSIDREFCLNNLRIYSVAISKTVVTLDTSVFNGCTNLTYLSFHPDSVCTTIGDSAFYRTNIIDLALPDSLTTIVAYAFFQSPSLTYVCIPKNVTAIGANAFNGCPKLTAVALPASLTTYGTATYFNTNGSTAPSTFTYYSAASAIPHFKLSDYSIPNGIVQNVIDSAVTYIDHTAYAYYPEITLYAVAPNKNTQTPGEYSYITNNVQFPIMPAAFWLNGGVSNNFASNAMFPIYTSVLDLNLFTGSSTANVWPDDGDDMYVLMPGYSICIYNNLYDEENLFTQSPTYRYYDNEFGSVPLNITINVANTTSSILIMCDGRILSKYFLS